MSKRLTEYQGSPSSFSYSFFRAKWYSENLSAIEQDAKHAEMQGQNVLGRLTSILTAKRLGTTFYFNLHQTALVSSGKQMAITLA